MKIANIVFWKVLLAILAISSSQFLEMKDKNSIPHKPNNEIDMILFPDIGHLGVIHLGDKKQAFNVILATGNDVTWVRDVKKFNSSEFNVLNCSQSSTCITTTQYDSFVYSAGGAIYGNKTYEKLSLGDLVLQNFSLVLADWDSGEIAGVDGVLGLGTSPKKNLHYPNLLDRLQSSGQIKSKSFSMYFGHQHIFNGEVTGKFIFGDYNPKYASGDFTFLNLTNTVSWTANLNAITLGSEEITTKALPICFDSLTDSIYLPWKIQNEIVEKLNCEWRAYEAPTYECDCNSLSQAPNLTFNFNGTLFSVPPSAYSFSYMVKDSKHCYLSIEEFKQPYPEYQGVLGISFLKNFYSYWNIDNKTIGLAPPSNQGAINSEKILY